MNSKSWFIASGISFGLWSLLMTGKWITDFTGFWFLLVSGMPLWVDFTKLTSIGWLVILARVVTLLLWAFIGVSLYKGFKGLKAQPQG